MPLLLLLLRLIVSIQNILVDWLGLSTILLLRELPCSRPLHLLGIDLRRAVGHQGVAIDKLCSSGGLHGILGLVADLRGLFSGTLSIRGQQCYILTINPEFEVELLALQVLPELIDSAALHRCLWIIAN